MNWKSKNCNAKSSKFVTFESKICLIKISELKFIFKGRAFLVSACIAVVFFYGCKGNEIYPIVPAIVFKDAFVVYNSSNTDSFVVLSFTYKDGDGDLGLDAGDSFPPYNTNTLGPNNSNTNRFANNIWVNYFQKANGMYSQPVIPFTSDTVREDIKVGNLTPDGANKAIRGEIRVQLNTVPRSYPDHSDTIKLKVRLIDRALNISNEIETPDLYLVR